MNTYFDKDIKIEVNYPEKWDIEANVDFAFQLFAPAKKEFAANIGFNQNNQDVSTPEKFRKLLNSVVSLQKTQYTDFKLLHNEETRIDGFPAYLYQFSWIYKEFNLKLIAINGYIAAEPARIIEINAVSLNDNFNDYLEDFKLIINSIKIRN